MGLEQVGVQLVADGYDRYMSQIRSAYDATSRFGSVALNEGVSGVNQLSEQSIVAGTAIGTVLGNALLAGIQQLVDCCDCPGFMFPGYQRTGDIFHELPGEKIVG